MQGRLLLRAVPFFVIACQTLSSEVQQLGPEEVKDLTPEETEKAVAKAERQQLLKDVQKGYKQTFGKEFVNDGENKLAWSPSQKAMNFFKELRKDYETFTGKKAIHEEGVADFQDNDQTLSEHLHATIKSMDALEHFMLGGKYRQLSGKVDNPRTPKQVMKFMADARKDYDYGVKGIPPPKGKKGGKRATVPIKPSKNAKAREIALGKHVKRKKAEKAAIQTETNAAKDTAQIVKAVQPKAKPAKAAPQLGSGWQPIPATLELLQASKDASSSLALDSGKKSLQKTHKTLEIAQMAHAKATGGVTAATPKSPPPPPLAVAPPMPPPPAPPSQPSKVHQKLSKALAIATPPPPTPAPVSPPAFAPPAPVPAPSAPVPAPSAPVPASASTPQPSATAHPPKAQPPKHEIAGSKTAWHQMMKSRARTVELGIKTLKKRKAKPGTAKKVVTPIAPVVRAVKQVASVPTKPKTKKTKKKTKKEPFQPRVHCPGAKGTKPEDHIACLQKRTKELQEKANVDRHEAYSLQRLAAVSPGGKAAADKQQQADWKAEQAKVVAAYMQAEADRSRNDYLIEVDREQKKSKLATLQKKRKAKMMKIAKKKAKKEIKKETKSLLKKEKRKAIKNAVKKAGKQAKKIMKMKKKKAKAAKKTKEKAKAKKKKAEVKKAMKKERKKEAKLVAKAAKKKKEEQKEEKQMAKAENKTAKAGKKPKEPKKAPGLKAVKVAASPGTAL